MPDYMYSLESRLSIEQRAALQRVQELANAGGLNVYLVGGAVRDLVSGMPIRDLDFALEGSPSRLAREIEKKKTSICDTWRCSCPATWT
jgi:tRNA nucleotidyltransferase/poly(A) polymerase